MARFISKTDPAEPLGDEEICLQIWFDEGQLNIKKLCSEYDAPIIYVL